jgi:hypothetical protein
MNAPRLSDTSRAAKGKRPEPHPDGSTDRLISMIVALTGEVASLRQRLDSVERVADGNGAFSQADVENYRPNPEVAVAQEELRRRIIENVFYLVTKELRDLRDGATPESYDAAVSAIAADR